MYSITNATIKNINLQMLENQSYQQSKKNTNTDRRIFLENVFPCYCMVFLHSLRCVTAIMVQEVYPSEEFAIKNTRSIMVNLRQTINVTVVQFIPVSATKTELGEIVSKEIISYLFLKKWTSPIIHFISLESFTYTGIYYVTTKPQYL